MKICTTHRLDNVATGSYIEGMLTVGVRELKNRLSEYLRAVSAGETVLVTDRGEVVAELTAPGQRALDSGMAPGLAALVRRGLVTPASASKDDANVYRPLPRRRRGKLGAAELLDQERGSR